MRAGEHPSPQVLLRFLMGEAGKAERRLVVRHLLRGCRGCTAGIAPILWHGDFRELPPPSRSEAEE
jgi:hypothetical protein